MGLVPFPDNCPWTIIYRFYLKNIASFLVDLFFTAKAPTYNSVNVFFSDRFVNIHDSLSDICRTNCTFLIKK
ncbi:hypothetical protein BpHYR1_051621 [Brachionus plicatilis]|uniref:Uncharacterized protein n=1 Tax=Brachionus plicatilis TaxID=10195 RepID=A0A3M7QZI2_BRAPC|nr:hypothetical protein BpHYR1_051621 [Brachionus plicatilis]